MSETTYQARRAELHEYFDRTAVEAWTRLTSDAPVNRIRATVRAGRDQMRANLLAWLPADLRGRRVLDAGCGTGALAVEAARRGAEVVAIDLSEKLVSIAAERQPSGLAGRIDYRVGDMFAPDLGDFDHVVAMDSLIHYRAADIVRVLGGFAARTDKSILFTFAPRTPALTVMHAAGRLFPRADRAPAIEPVGARSLARLIAAAPGLAGFSIAREKRIDSLFYKSQAMALASTRA